MKQNEKTGCFVKCVDVSLIDCTVKLQRVAGHPLVCMRDRSHLSSRCLSLSSLPVSGLLKLVHLQERVRHHGSITLICMPDVQ